jgi:uncharacterized protein YqgC (DUF456 family)
MDLLTIAALAFMALGLAGIAIPGLPGVLLVFGVAAIYSLLTGFDEFNVGWLALMGVIAAAATTFDLIAAPAVARRFGASKWGVLGAIAGLVVGLFVGGPLGALFGPLIGATVAELVFSRDIQKALRGGLGTAVGFVTAMVVDFTAAVTIIGLFVVLVVT